MALGGDYDLLGPEQPEPIEEPIEWVVAFEGYLIRLVKRTFVDVSC